MKKVAAIIGGGVIGAGWLARFLLNGWDVRVFDPDLEVERKVDEVLLNAKRALPMLYDFKLPEEGNLYFCSTIKETVEDAVWIQESVPERLDIKQAVLSEIQTYCKKIAVIGSSTSGFMTSQLQENSSFPDQIMVCHPFNPVYLLPLVEVVPGNLTSDEHFGSAKMLLQEVGFFPLHVRKEIDAHIADRFLEAVWREALWLIKDGIATTEEIDNAIRYGFGLRWAQMGLFETYRVAGGEGGMAHFIEQFGPCLKWPWTKLMDVPELTKGLIKDIADQSDFQSGKYSIRELERIRDDNLIVILRALKQQDQAAGKIVNGHEKKIINLADIAPKMRTVSRKVPVDWTDYNGHMNEGRYGQVYSDAADGFLWAVGADKAYVASGYSYFTVETSVKFLNETHAGQDIIVDTTVKLIDGKKLKLFHSMQLAEGGCVLSTCEQFLLHIDMKKRKSSLPVSPVAENLQNLSKKI